MSDVLHRILTGQTISRKELAVAGIVVGVWFAMDLVQWIDWAVAKWHGACS